MSGVASLLKEIHRLRKYSHELKEQIDRGPKQLKTQQARVARQEEILREAQDALKKLKVAQNDKEVSLKGTHASIKKHEQQLNEAGSTSEYAALQHQIATEREKTTKLEDEILTAMTEVEEQAARLPALEANVKSAREELAKFEATQGERVAALRAELTKAQTELAEVEKTLPDNVRPQFNREVQSKGHDAFSAVRDLICTACYTEITAEMQNDLSQGRFILCKSCGRMLYPGT